MSSALPDITFLQLLYGEETLYVVPDQQVNQEAIPAAVAVVPQAITPPVPNEIPITAAAAAPVPDDFYPESSVQDIKWLGEAVKGTYLLFEVADEVFNQLPQHIFLQKVLSAVGLTTMQVRFGNLPTTQVHDVKKIAAHHQAQHILLFGQGLPVANLDRMEFYRMYKSEEARFVLVDSLEDIEKSVELKKKLWDVLQKIFIPQN